MPTSINFNWVPKVPKPFHVLYKISTVIDEIVARSGRVSGKSYAFRDYCFLKLLEKKGNHIIVTRAEQNDIRGSVFSLFNSLIHQTGMEMLFDIKQSPFEITYRPYGNKIFFHAINSDINRTKGFEIPFGVIAVIWHEECQEMDDFMYIDAANTTYVRFFDKDSKILYSYNPPEGVTHWANLFFPKKVQLKEAIEIYSTWEDIRALLTGQTIKKIMQMKEHDPEYYKYWYLGEVINLRGAVFRMFDPAKHVIKTINMEWLLQNTKMFIIGVDSAIKNDATAMGIGAMLIDGRLVIVDAYYYDPKVTGVQLDDIEQSRRMAKHLNDFFERNPNAVFKQWVGTVDNANFNLLLMLRKSDEFNKKFPRNNQIQWFPATDKNIMRDTKRLQNMFGEDLIVIYAPEPNPYKNANYIGVAQLQGYVYDLDPKKAGEIKANQEDHYIDMLKYMTYMYMYPNNFKV